MSDQAQWRLSGDYFENCSCEVVCPCLVSKNAPLTSRPTNGVCDVALIFHIDSGRYDGIALDGEHPRAGVLVRDRQPDGPRAGTVLNLCGGRGGQSGEWSVVSGQWSVG